MVFTRNCRVGTEAEIHGEPTVVWLLSSCPLLKARAVRLRRAPSNHAKEVKLTGRTRSRSRDGLLPYTSFISSFSFSSSSSLASEDEEDMSLDVEELRIVGLPGAIAWKFHGSKEGTTCRLWRR